MSGNTFGSQFRVTTAGESHGSANVVIIDGVPAGLEIDPIYIQSELNRRRPGQSALVTRRDEKDQAEILSGIFEGRATGAPIAIKVDNTDARSKDYANIQGTYRPGHADYTWDAKYGFRDYRGGGRASARETLCRVAAGAIAKLFLRSENIEIIGFTSSVGDLHLETDASSQYSLAEVEAHPTRCPDPDLAERMAERIEQARKSTDSIGGSAEIRVFNCPPGLGEPVFDKLKADLAKAMFSIPAVVGLEVGAGFRATEMSGSEFNDPFVLQNGKVVTETNHHGGLLGGMSSGMPIILRVAIKPASSIAQPQNTVNQDGESMSLIVKGRHDPCLVPRFVPVGEAMAAITIADHLLRQRSARL